MQEAGGLHVSRSTMHTPRLLMSPCCRQGVTLSLESYVVQIPILLSCVILRFFHITGRHTLSSELCP